MSEDVAEIIEAEVIRGRATPLWSEVRGPGVGDWQEGDCALIRQSSTRPVARGWTMEEDSNGSIAHDLFKLRTNGYGGWSMRS